MTSNTKTIGARLLSWTFLVGSIGILEWAITSCAHVPDRTNKGTLIMVRELIDQKEPKCIASVRVFHDGSYVLERLNPHSTVVTRANGQLSSKVLTELEAVAKSGAVNRSHGPPRYDYFPENSYSSAPKAVDDLFEAIIK